MFFANRITGPRSRFSRVMRGDRSILPASIMKRVVQILLAAMILVAASPAQSRNVQVTLGLITKGKSLSKADAEALEKSIAAKPDDQEARIQLLAYYAGSPASADIAAVKAA